MLVEVLRYVLLELAVVSAVFGIGQKQPGLFGKQSYAHKKRHQKFDALF